MKKILALITVCVFTGSAIAQVDHRVTADEITGHISFLASDSLKGRKPGTLESKVAADYIRNRLADAGLHLIDEDGFQYFELVTGVKMGEQNRMNINGMKLEIGEEYTPLSFSENATVTAPAVFVGYGFDIINDSVQWNDYASLDVDGKWAVMFRGAPDAGDPTGKFRGNVKERMKVMMAKDHGAAGVILINAPSADQDDKLMHVQYDKSPATAGIPVIQMKYGILDSLMKTFGMNLKNVAVSIKSGMSPFVFSIPYVFSVQTDVIHQKARTQNVVAMLEGDHRELREEIIVIGAHYDHLGMGGPGSGSRALDTIAVHYGADDNASGVAGVIELAEYLALADNQPDRSIVFIAFGAEEMGLVGSKYFVENPPVDLDNVVAMINFDMIGRLKEDKSIAIGGTGTSEETEDILDQLKARTSLKLNYSKEGYGPSDHAAFYTAGIPVFFISTGAHSDYHTPMDRAEFINATGQVEVLEFTAGLIGELASRDERLAFKEAGPTSRSRSGYSFKVTLGIMPDFTGSSNDGLRVDAVRPDGPAHRGGMKKGDRIVAMDGKPVENIYDYMGRLKQFESGQTITVDVIRNGKKEVLLITL